MKKTLLLIAVIFAFNSCNNLNLVPLDRVSSANFYKTAADFDGAIFASYSSIQDLWGTSTETLGELGEYWKISVVTSDDVETDPNNAWDGISQSIDQLILRASDNPFAAAYTQIYEGIMRANLVIENVNGDNELTSGEKEMFEAEARFLRAFFHFEAMKLWGTPPLLTKNYESLSDLSVKNATQDELFTQILSDFNFAYQKLPPAWDGGNTGRATKWAARAFEGKVNVWKKDWPKAITAFEDVINSGRYSLIDTGNPVEDFDAVFAYDNENNSESIFEIQFGGPYSDDNIWVFDDTHSEAFKASQGIARSWYWDAANAPGGKMGWWAPTQDLVDAFEPGDARLEVSIYKDGDVYYYLGYDPANPLMYDPTWSSTGYTVKKYSGARNSVSSDRSPNEQSDFNNERIFRYAELKLLYAEALIENNSNLGVALQQINDIRNRAGLSNLAIPLDQASLTAAMRQEKRVELAFEPHRWFDITRWDIGSTVFGATWNAKYKVYPFPQTEIDRTGAQLNQNTGY